MPTEHQPDSPIKSPLGGTMTRSVLKRALIVGALAVLLLVLLVTVFRNSPTDSPPTDEDLAEEQNAPNADLIVRDDSHRLDDVPDSDVTFVEFLDFECEACGAVYPAVEALRDEYEGQINVVIRYFPLDGHPNSRQAAHAVEAAARQGELEAMYQRMFETQEEWSHNEEPQDEVFRGFAEDLGLDVEQWEEEYYSDDVAERVQADFEDAVALGLRGTPSFFINDQPVSPETMDDLTDPINDALENQ
ncbi:thioredoxin domain-containing protein [Nesterenkonia massiliensis]|uniref:DsbA family protein n=1 Tax=Nesterenkonia massiliensis TaxID=1232429 RepID=UPI000405C99B|nr:thioredoxin domain-containing protein [Nesterenkonia massiliensis]